MWFVAPQLLKEIYTHSQSERYVVAAREWAAAAEAEKTLASARGLSVAGGVARIQVSGLLTKRPSFMAWLMGGGTTYAQISQGLQEAAADSSIKSIELEVDSGGGEADGLFTLFDQIAAVATQKRIDVIAHKAQSAAYGISAATGGKITPVSAGSVFGSIGVAASYFVDPQVVNIASSNAPNKRPDMVTEEGRKVVQAELDQMHDAFVAVIARGRSAATGEKISAGVINDTYGRGGSMLAVQAFEAGLIDAKPKKTAVKRTASTNSQPTTTGDKDMKFSEYLAAHPENAKAALDGARQEENARCLSHMKLAKKSGCYDLAEKAIEAGTAANDSSVVFDHLEAKGRSGKVENRQAETGAVAQQLAGVSETPKADLGDQLADAVGAPALEADA